MKISENFYKMNLNVCLWNSQYFGLYFVPLYLHYISGMNITLQIIKHEPTTKPIANLQHNQQAFVGMAGPEAQQRYERALTKKGFAKPYSTESAGPGVANGPAGQH